MACVEHGLLCLLSSQRSSGRCCDALPAPASHLGSLFFSLTLTPLDMLASTVIGVCLLKDLMLTQLAMKAVQDGIFGTKLFP